MVLQGEALPDHAQHPIHGSFQGLTFCILSQVQNEPVRGFYDSVGTLYTVFKILWQEKI